MKKLDQYRADDLIYALKLIETQLDQQLSFLKIISGKIGTGFFIKIAVFIAIFLGSQDLFIKYFPDLALYKDIIL